MKNIFKFAAVSAALLLGACSKDAPDIQGGTEDLKYVVSSNVLNSDKVPMEMDYARPIVFVMVDSLSQVSVTVDAGGTIVPVRVTQSGDSVIVTPVLGAWTKSAYQLTLVGSFGSGVAVNFTINLTREPGLNLVSANFWDVKNETGYLEVPVSVGELTLEFDQDIDSVEQFRLVASTGVEVATTTAIDGNVLTATIGVDSLEFKATYSVFYTVRTEAGLKASQADITPANETDFLFKTAVTTFLPVSSNVKVLNTAVGEETYDFPLQDTLTVTFSEKLNTDLRRLAWSASTSTFDLGNNKGTGASGLLESNVIIDGATLRVVPVHPLTGVSNGSTVGFRVNVQAARDVNLSYTVEVQAYLRDNKLYVVSTNVLDSVGKYRAFKVTGDSLVVTFSKAIKAAGFKVNGFVGNYKVTWDTTATVATIKNVDTLDAGEYSDVTPYEYAPTTASTCKYGCAAAITFSAVAADDGMTYAPTFSGYSLQVHTEFDLALVDVNVLEGHRDATVPVSLTEDYKDTLNDSTNVVFTFNRALDTNLIKTWITKDAQTDRFAYIWYYDKDNNPVHVSATVTLSNAGRTLTLNPVEKLSVFRDGNNAGPKTQYLINIDELLALGLKKADGIASITLASGATGYFELPSKMVDISKLVVGLKKDTVATSKNRYDSVSVALTTEAFDKDASTLALRIVQPSLNQDSIKYYQYRTQVTYRNGVKSGWFYSTEKETPSYKGLLSTSDEIAGMASIAKTIDLDDMPGLKVWDKDGSNLDYLNGLAFFNDSSIIEVQVRGVNENDATKDDDDSYTAWSTSIKFVDNVAPFDPVYPDHNAYAEMTSVALDRRTLSATTQTFTFHFDEDMDVSTTPTITFYPTSATAAPNKPVLSSASSWTDARTYEVIYTYAAQDYSAITSVVASVMGMKDASGVAIKSTGSAGVLATSGPVSVGSNMVGYRVPTAGGVLTAGDMDLIYP